MIRKFSVFAAALSTAIVLGPTWVGAAEAEADKDGYFSLFDGKSLDGWKAGEHPDSFKVEDGTILVSGERGHLFYEGPVGEHDFKNFELKLEVMTEPGANSGIYFHTKFQDEDWPFQGYECQVNNSQSDWRRTGSLYAIEDVRETRVKDNEWFEYTIRVEGKKITLMVNGDKVVDFTEPTPPAPPSDKPGRMLSHGTIALQAHDPGSTVRFRNIRIKPLP